MSKFFATCCLAASLCIAGSSAFASINYNTNVTNSVIWGTGGNSNGGFTVVQDNGIELGIRGKTRYPAPNDSPAGIMNQGNGTYGSFPTGNFGPGGVRGSWNFTWSVNSDFANGTTPLDTYNYVIDIDFEPNQGTNFLSFDLLGNPLHFDHGFGNNTTPNDTGTKATSLANAQTLATTNNLMQNSWNLAFFAGPLAFDPTADATYTIRLSALSDTGLRLATNSIDVIVGAGGAAIPEPMTLLTWCGLIGCAIFATRRGERS
jgi:hypothetical protein